VSYGEFRDASSAYAGKSQHGTLPFFHCGVRRKRTGAPDKFMRDISTKVMDERIRRFTLGQTKMSEEEIEHYSKLWNIAVPRLKEILSERPSYIEDRLNFHQKRAERLAKLEKDKPLFFERASTSIDEPISSFDNIDFGAIKTDGTRDLLAVCQEFSDPSSFVTRILHGFINSNLPKQDKVQFLRSLVLEEAELLRLDAALKLVETSEQSGYTWLKQLSKDRPDLISTDFLDELRRFA